MTKADAAKLAKAINIVAADLPGYTSSPHDNSDDGSEEQLALCVGATPPSQNLAEVSSDDFSKDKDTAQEVDISSSVQILPTLANVQRDIAALRSSKYESCGRAYLEKTFKDEGADATIDKLETNETRVLGADFANTLDVVVTLRASGVTHTFVAHTTNVAVGRAEMNVDVETFGATAPVDLGNVLAAKLVERAHAQLG